MNTVRKIERDRTRGKEEEKNNILYERRRILLLLPVVCASISLKVLLHNSSFHFFPFSYFFFVL